MPANAANAANAANIIAHLDAVSTERKVRAKDAALGRRVTALKRYQQQRFANTHASALAHPRFGAAAHFFLEDIYGPSDFSDRDAQFARVVPALVRLFPQEIVQTIDVLAELHALSEQLDSRMATHLPDEAWGRMHYVGAWQTLGCAAGRNHQLNLILQLGHDLDHFTRSRILRQTLRMMRGPASAAGLSALQTFLERGFDTFAAMKGAEPFLAMVRSQEQRLLARLFEADAVAGAAALSISPGDPLGQLP